MIMKKKLFVSIVVALFALPVLAQEARRDVLFVMGPHEEIYAEEYQFRLKANDVNYACVLYDTVSEEETLIYNGERKGTVEYVYYIDLNDFNRFVFTFSGKDGKYIFANGHNYGPYKEVRSDMYEREPMTSGRFVFSYEGSDIYVHDYDGKIYPLKDGRHEYKSLNKQHTLKVSNDYTTYTLDGYEFTLPLPENFEISTGYFEYYPVDIFVFNNGNCFIDIHGKTPETGYYSASFFVEGFYVKKLSDQRVDFESGELAGSARDSFINKQNFENNPHSFSFSEDDYDYVENEETGEYQVAYEFVMNDRSDRHSFFANWKHDYVIIDGKHYGRACPIEAKYDAENNRFIWFAIEGREVVRYIFQL